MGSGSLTEKMGFGRFSLDLDLGYGSSGFGWSSTDLDLGLGSSGLGWFSSDLDQVFRTRTSDSGFHRSWTGFQNIGPFLFRIGFRRYWIFGYGFFGFGFGFLCCIATQRCATQRPVSKQIDKESCLIVGKLTGRYSITLTGKGEQESFLGVLYRLLFPFFTPFIHSIWA